MVTIKPVLHSRKNRDGKYPVAIRITKDRKSSYLFTGIILEKNQWNNERRTIRKNYPNSARANALLSKKIAEANKKYLGLEVNDKEVSAKAIHRNVKKKEGQGSFITQSELYLDLLVKEGKYNRAQSDRPRINRFIKFVNNQNIAFNEITVNLLKKFKAHLKEVYKVSDRTAINYLIVLRTIYNQGIKDGVAEDFEKCGLNELSKNE